MLDFSKETPDWMIPPYLNVGQRVFICMKNRWKANCEDKYVGVPVTVVKAFGDGGYVESKKYEILPHFVDRYSMRIKREKVSSVNK